MRLRAAAGVIERPRTAIVMCQMETVAAVKTEGLVLYSDSLSDTSWAGEEGWTEDSASFAYMAPGRGRNPLTDSVGNVYLRSISIYILCPWINSSVKERPEIPSGDLQKNELLMSEGD